MDYKNVFKISNKLEWEAGFSLDLAMIYIKLNYKRTKRHNLSIEQLKEKY